MSSTVRNRSAKARPPSRVDGGSFVLALDDKASGMAACRGRGLVPEARVEGTFDRSSRVATLVGHVANGVFLLQGVSSGQRAKPLARAPERSTTIQRVVLWLYACDQIASTPADGTFGLVDEGAERR